MLKTPSKIGSQFVRFSEDLWTCTARAATIDYVNCVYVTPEDEVELMRECERWKVASVEKGTAWLTPEARVEAFSKALCREHYLDTSGNHLTECHTAYQEWIEGLHSLDPQDTLLSATTPIKNGFGHRVKSLTLGRSFFITKMGFLGLGPASAQPEDIICNLESSSDPFIFRSLPHISTEAASVAFVGDTVILGLMDGEGSKDMETQNIQEYWIQ